MAVSYYVTATSGTSTSPPSNIVSGTSTIAQASDYVGKTLGDLTNNVLWRFGEAFQSEVGDFDVSMDFSPKEMPVKTTNQLIALLLNEAAAKLCRGPLFVYATGVQELTLTNRAILYQSLAMSDASVIWSAEAVQWMPDSATVPVSLRYIGKERAELRYGPAGTSGKPTQYWSHSGNGVRLWELPSVTGSAIVRGPSIPPPMVLPTDYPGWLPPDMTYLLEDYARIELARKVGQSVVVRGHLLFPKVQLWQDQYQAAVNKIEAQHRAENPMTYEFHLGPHLAP